MKRSALEQKIQELQLKAKGLMLAKGNAEVPSKKHSKPVGYKLQNTFESNLRGVPGGKGGGGVINMIAARTTGTRLGPSIGVLRSARNANTTQGSYITTIVHEETNVVSDAQGRKVFGR